MGSEMCIRDRRCAAQACVDKELHGMVTAPVHKGIINDAGIAFSGHTEFLAEFCHVDLTVMMLATEGLRVALATTHLPLRHVADAITAQLPAEWRGSWEVVVFQEDSANAFALPGKKIGVHTGIFKVATNADQLATVIGHEVAHVIAQHSAERMSLQSVAGTGTQLLAVLMGDSPQKASVMAMLGLGAQYGLVLPYGLSLIHI